MKGTIETAPFLHLPFPMFFVVKGDLALYYGIIHDMTWVRVRAMLPRHNKTRTLICKK
jgi:hypothetical protein